MRRKCDAALTKNLILRGRMYYYRTDYKTSDGKRHAFRRSLHTSDFCTAVAFIKRIKYGAFQMNDALTTAEKFLNKIQKIDKNMTPEEMLYIEQMNQKMREAAARACGGPSDKWAFATEQTQQAMYGLDFGATQQSVATPISQSVSTVVTPVKKSISIEAMIARFRKGKDTKCEKYCRVRAQRLNELVKAAGLTPHDDFRTFVEYEHAQKVFDYINARPDTGARTRRKLFGYFEQLIKYAILVDRDLYDTHILAEFPIMPKLKKCDKGEHVPFTDEELNLIFREDVDTFDKKPYLFWVCVIAMFSGSRQNAAYTLQYKDIREIDGVWCMDFVDDSPIKQLKTTASERPVPIHLQQRELGFLEMVFEQKKRLGASDKDFIFPTCKTKNGHYNGHITRDFCEHLVKVGIKKKDARGHCIKDGKDMHSLRNNASIKMQSAINPAMVNRIIGWDGKDARESSYSKFGVAAIAAEMEKFNYDEIMPKMRYWAKRTIEKILSLSV